MVPTKQWLKAYKQLALACGELARIETRVQIPGAGAFNRARNSSPRSEVPNHSLQSLPIVLRSMVDSRQYF